MNQQELKQRLQHAYGDEPASTHAAYEFALTHPQRREEAVGAHRGKLRLIPLLALLLALLTAGGYAAAKLYSVTQYPPRSGLTDVYLDHVISLNQAYENELFTLSVNDLVFDGETVEVAMNIDRKSEEAVYFLDMEMTAQCKDESYRVDVEGCGNGDFMSGFLCPSQEPLLPDASENEYSFSGVLWNDDMQMPPEGEPIDWTLTFHVAKPLWPLVYMDEDTYNALVTSGDTGERQMKAAHLNAWREHQILYTYANLVEYRYYVLYDGLKLPDEEIMALSPVEELVRTGAFAYVDTIVCRFTTTFNDHTNRTELVGSRYSLGDYALVLDELHLSFQRLTLRAHVDFGREMTEAELDAADIPRCWRVCFNGQPPEEAGKWDHAYINLGYEFDAPAYTQITRYYLEMVADIWPPVAEVHTITLVPEVAQEDGTSRFLPDLAITIPLDEPSEE